MNSFIKKLDNKKECATATIHALSHDGRGIATIHNKTTFVSGALPGETCTYQITQKHSSYNNAESLEIIETSPERIAPPCRHFGTCGGCHLQHMSTDAQIRLKQQTLLDQLKHFGRITPQSILPPLHANSTGYRRKARLGVKFVIKKNKLLIGFREKSSRYLADLEHCAILHPQVGERFSALSNVISSLEQYRTIPQVEVAIGDKEVALVFRHLEPLSDSDKQKLSAFGKDYAFQIYLQPNLPAIISKLWPQDNFHRLTYTLPDYSLEFLFHPLDFTQINLEVNQLMVKQAIQLLDLKPEDNVLDLFCGIGNFTLPITRYANHVTGIEGSMEMVTRANDNAKHNGITNAQFHTANLMEESLTKACWMKSHYNKILLDPPRAGAKEILAFINQCNATKIVYVSCNPATFARDAGILVHQYGYVLKQAGVMNMFPHTSHVEVMAAFEKS
ncbi:MAG: 23S rRNA (uracil(1939)-C(5))-methyltransferase RlmD [Gammaproteobacteria bacterium]|nr:23S rRNA (uracil(1939)-C(5))-methyltransferase RlmD [Gammaproteobacteria bacterium]MCW5583441.1 23S rRNA (uracil(1939)-C(5))-methyltransferase RlmD [Gammaproteobacteria bacterium]